MVRAGQHVNDSGQSSSQGCDEHDGLRLRGSLCRRVWRSRKRLL
jgi:hypothetical protein